MRRRRMEWARSTSCSRFRSRSPRRVRRKARHGIGVSQRSTGPNVRLFEPPGMSAFSSFMAYSPSFAGGVRVAAGDVNGDGLMDVVTAPGPGGAPNVKVFDGKTGMLLQSF